MKKLLTIFFFLPLLSFGISIKYYVSNSGNDANAGTIGAPWLTISKVNSFNFTATDSILFKRGDTFYGGIVAKKIGLNYGAYGSGAKPVVTGLTSVSGWINVGTNLYEAPVLNVKAAVNLVMRDAEIMQVGRFPNTNATNSGWLTLTSATNTSVTGPALSSTTNWTGAEIAVRSRRWEIRRRRVTAHSGGVVSFADLGIDPSDNFGYFFQRDSRTLDQDGEWYYNSTFKTLRVYSTANPNTHLYQIATVDSLFTSVYNTTSVRDIEFYGAGMYGINMLGKVGITVLNCDVNYSGAHGINEQSSNVLIDGCTVRNSLGTGIRGRSNTTGIVNLTITNNYIDSTSLKAGMEISDAACNALLATGGQNVIVTNNIIKNSGYNAIEWKGDNVIIQNNFIDNYCSVRDDGAGIYTYKAAGGGVSTSFNRNILSNIIINGIGAPDGASKTDNSALGILQRSSANGIYNDEGTSFVYMEGNTIALVALAGFTGNGNTNLTIRNNTVYKVPFTHSSQRLTGELPMTGFIIKKNIFYPYRWRFRDQDLDVTQNEDLQRLGVLDSNYYSTKTGTDTSLTVQTAPSGGSNWRSFSYIKNTLGMETHSVNYVNTGLLFYNASDVETVETFSGLSKIDVYGNVYNNSATIPPWSSKVLMSNGVTTTTPTANAGTDYNITLPVDFKLITGSGNKPGGTVISYSWLQISGPNTATNSNPNSASTTISGMIEGAYAFRLKITGSGGVNDTAIDVMQIFVAPAVPPVNTPPLAVAGNNQTITSPSNTADLDGSGSSDPGGSISSYNWAQLPGAPNTATNSTPNASTTTVGNLIQGVYQFELTITDNLGAITKDVVQITVEGALLNPTVEAGLNREITLPNSDTTLTADTTAYGGATISTVLWEQMSGPATANFSVTNSVNTAVSNLVEGVYIFRITATDSNGLTAQSSVQVTVLAVIVPGEVFGIRGYKFMVN